jgi:hypothetical protein
MAPDPGPGTLSLYGVEALLQRYRGELEPAAEQLTSLCAQARAAGNLQFLLSFLSDLSEPLLELGREAEAEAALQEAASLEDRLKEGTSSLFGMVTYRAKQGQIEAARQLLVSVRARLAGRPLNLIGAVQMGWAEANLQAAEKRWPEAWASFAYVVDQLTRAGARWYRAQVLRDWAEAHLARGEAGDAERARELLHQVIAEFEAMGAPIYAGRVLQRLKEVDT